MNTHPINRRQFVKRAAVVAGALGFPFVASRNVLGANERLNIAGIGVGGKGASDLGNVDYENIAALCDVDESRAGESFNRYPMAKRFKDFRVMLEKEGKSIDAVTVSTPDHMHAPAAILAMKLGKHVYCQKPLTRTVQEARQMAEVARQIVPGGSVDDAVAALNADPKRTIRGAEAFRQWMQDLSDRTVAELNGTHFDIPEPIRTLGDFRVGIRLHPDVRPEITVHVVKE